MNNPLTSILHCRSIFLVALLFFAPPLPSIANDIQLPELGDATSGIISKQQEYELGRAWLKAFRGSVRTHDDPLMQQYLEQLIYELATYSDLEHPRLELVIVNNPTMNAFAVPGGVVGFHTGVFNYAENEDQMVSVLAHELAHLSQRHFARGVEASRKNTTLNLAGMLASLVILATAGGDAGTAALATTQALALDNQLRYSRSNEQEADRIGLQTMERAGRNPAAVAGMFESMLRATRFTGSRPPEFLLTHPITEKRISDARNRAMGISSMHFFENNLYFYLMRARAITAIEKNPQICINRFTNELNSSALPKEGTNYGLALSYKNAGNYTQARKINAELINNSPSNLAYLHLDIELDISQQRYKTALQKLNNLLTLNSNNYPLTLLKSEILWQANRYEESADILSDLSKTRPTDPSIWYKLAEVRGLAGNISGVHLARTEYFILTGVFNRAREQLGLALKLVGSDFKQSAIIKQRLKDLVEMEKNLKRL